MNMSAGGRRLERLLKMIPFLQANNGIKIEEVATIFETSEEQIISDLNLIWLCGLPGYSHLELIDVSFDSGYISITNADTVGQPMRLTTEESVSLLLAIDNLINVVPERDSKVLHTLRVKLLSLLNLKVSPKTEFPADTSKIAEQPVLPKILKMINNPEQALAIDYYSASADQVLYSQIIPMEIYNRNTFTYLMAFSITKEEYVIFRLDRIQRAEVIAKPEYLRNLPARGELSGSPSIGEEVSVELNSQALWFIEKWALNTLKFDSARECYVGVITVFNRQWLVRSAIALEGALRILSPADLRVEIYKAANSALDRRQ
jgi:proteasome accessory factor C